MRGQLTPKLLCARKRARDCHSLTETNKPLKKNHKLIHVLPFLYFGAVGLMDLLREGYLQNNPLANFEIR
jgi:hypothetical protein